jgi:branched-subunit amino acid transport protein
MSLSLLALCLIVGAATYAARFGPTRIDLGALPEGGWLSRALAAIGPAAIAALAAASVLPFLHPLDAPLPLSAGTAAVPALFAATRSVVVATLGGALAYGVVVALTA